MPGRQTAAHAEAPAADPELLHRQAQAAVLAALLRGSHPDQLVAAVAPAELAGWFTPDVAMLELGVTALELAVAAGDAPLEYEGLRERFLPEITFSGKTQHRNSQYALYATACLRGGLRPDLERDAGWWNTRLWSYAVYALLIYSRAAADRHDSSLEQIAGQIAERHALGDEVDQRLADADPRRL